MNEQIASPGTSLEATLLIESLRSRASQARLAYLSAIVSICAFTPLLLQTVPLAVVSLWFLPVVVALTWRLWIAWQVSAASGVQMEQRAAVLDRQFRVNSIVTQCLVGAGVWSVAATGNDVTPYFVTLLVSLFGVGAAASLGNDFRTVLISMPLCLGQPILFWAIQGWDGLHVALPLSTIMVLLIAFTRQTQRIHTDSIAIRYRNDELLARLAQEKATAVRAQHQAEAANQSKSKFLAAASHDLRQPLYAVTMLKDTLAMHELPDDVRQIVKQQGVALDALSSLFDNLLQISRLESGTVDVRLEPIALDALLEQLVSEVRPACEAKGIHLELSCEPVFVESDADLLGRLLRNLLSNAVRYTESGSIAVRARLVGQQVDIEVLDTGPGIAEADQQRVFDEFVQLNNPQRSRAQGTGLGLSIVRHIAKLLELPIELESRLGKGTLIRVRMQRKTSCPALSSPTHGVHSSSEARAGRLWVVEDDELVRSAFDVHLKALGFSVEFAVSKQELVQLADSNGWPDYLILDDMLGGEENGLDLARWAAKRMPSDRILIVTGNAEPERLEVLEASGFEVKRKPLSNEELVRWISR